MDEDPADDPEDPEADPRRQRWERRLAVPVLVAALASVPAVWLTLLEEPYATVGVVANWLAGAVLVGETLVLLLVGRSRLRWLRENWWLVGLTLLTVAAVVLALGPVQLLRLVRALGALRVLRAGRIVSAARRVRRRAGLSSRWSAVLTIGAGVVVAVFVAAVLSDPTSRSRLLVEDAVGAVLGPVPGTVLVVVAGLLLGVATFVTLRRDDDE